MMYSVGLKGIDVDNAAKVETLIVETLADLAAHGIAADAVEAAVNTVEFRLRENNTGGFPRGLAMMVTALGTWVYGGDPLAPIAFEAPLNAIKAKLAGGDKYFEGLIQTWLLNNPHRATVLLKPDETVRAQRDAAEKARLAGVRAPMTPVEMKGLVGATRHLKEMQEKPDAPEELAKLPTLKLADLDKQVKTIPISVQETRGSKVIYHDLFTNGIAYLDLGFNLRVLPQEY